MHALKNAVRSKAFRSKHVAWHVTTTDEPPPLFINSSLLCWRHLCLVSESDDETRVRVCSLDSPPLSPRPRTPTRSPSRRKAKALSLSLRPPIVIEKGPRGFGFTLQAIRVFYGDTNYYTVHHLVSVSELQRSCGQLRGCSNMWYDNSRADDCFQAIMINARLIYFIYLCFYYCFVPQNVEHGSAAFESGLRPGDLLTHVNDEVWPPQHLKCFTMEKRAPFPNRNCHLKAWRPTTLNGTIELFLILGNKQIELSENMPNSKPLFFGTAANEIRLLIRPYRWSVLSCRTTSGRLEFAKPFWRILFECPEWTALNFEPWWKCARSLPVDSRPYSPSSHRADSFGRKQAYPDCHRTRQNLDQSGRPQTTVIVQQTRQKKGTHPRKSTNGGFPNPPLPSCRSDWLAQE